MLCNANPKKKKKKKQTNKQTNKEEWSQRIERLSTRTVTKKTQLDRAFCIQNFLDATLVLELLFILEC